MVTERALQIVRQFSQNGTKLLLENPENVRDLLALARAGVLDLIDFKRMEVSSTSFVAPDYRRVESDVVLTAPLRLKGGRKGTEVVVYVLIEHQSEPDELMTFRVLEYVVQIFRSQLRQWGQEHPSLAGARLQPVLPVVFYTGTRSWDRLASLAELTEGAERLARWLPAVEPLFVNLAELEPAQLQAEGGYLGQVLRLVQRRHARLAEFEALLQDVVRRLEQGPRGKGCAGWNCFRTLWAWCIMNVRQQNAPNCRRYSKPLFGVPNIDRS
jgi:hypothetical protein